MRDKTIIYSFMNASLVVVFMVAICLPLVGSVLSWDLTGDLGEKRLLAECPAFGQDPVKVIPEKFNKM